MADRCKMEMEIDDNRFAISGKVPTDGNYDTKEKEYFPVILSWACEFNVKQHNLSRQ